MAHMTTAIQTKDFQAFGRICMQESNSFHAICLDTYPPIFYLNAYSHVIMDIVHRINSIAGKIILAYTFDAGPHATVFHLGHDPHIRIIFNAVFHGDIPHVDHTFPHWVKELLRVVEHPEMDVSWCQHMAQLSGQYHVHMTSAKVGNGLLDVND